MTMTLEELSDNMELVLAKLAVYDAKSVGGFPPATAATPNTLAVRDANADVKVRSISYSLPSQSAIPQDSSLAFRVNSSDDSLLRAGSRTAVVNWLGRVNDSDKLYGKTIQELKEEIRFGLVPASLTINEHRLDGNFNLTAYDVGLGNTPNYPAVNSFEGQSTTLLATQKAVYDAAFAPKLEPARKRKITLGTAAVSGVGEEGEIYIQV